MGDGDIVALASNTELPIDVIPGPPGSGARRFRWEQAVDTPIGRKIVQSEGCLPPSVESNVHELIWLYKKQCREVTKLQAEIDALKAQLIEVEAKAKVEVISAINEATLPKKPESPYKKK